MYDFVTEVTISLRQHLTCLIGFCHVRAKLIH